MSQETFGKKLGVTGAGISKIESGDRKLTEQMALAICREFNVREEWLRSGNGEMFIDFTEDEFSKAAATLSNDAFIRSLIIEYWKLDEDSKGLFRDFIHKLSNGIKNYEAYVSNPSSIEQSATEEAETAYIKSRLDSVAKTKSSAWNTTEDTVSSNGIDDKAANQ